MTFTLEELAKLVGGTLSGDGDILLSGADTIRDARPGDITLADKPELAKRLSESSAAAVVVPPEVQPEGLSFITVENVHAAFAQIVSQFRPQPEHRPCGISPQAFVAVTAKIGDDVEIHPGATVADDVEIGDRSVIHSGARVMAGCKIGQDTTIFPNAVLYENTVVGDRAIIHAGAVIGAYGFGYQTIEGRHRLSAQLGNVEICDEVEIGACSTIDRGTYGSTVIGEGTKIDNQVMIGHNCRLGKHNFLASQAGVAGSCSTGDYVVMAGQVGLADHIHIGDRTTLGAKAGVMNDIPADSVYVGIPATPAREQMVKQAAFAKLPEMRKQLKALERAVAQRSEQQNSAARDAA